MKVTDQNADAWKGHARRSFPDFGALVDQSTKPGEFLDVLCAALPADLSSDTARQYLRRLDLFIGSSFADDTSFRLRRGVSKGIRQFRDKLETAASPPPSPQAIAQAVAAVNAFAKRFLDDTENSREALAWLETGDRRHTLGELANTAVSIRLVNSFYKAGATKVWAVDIDRYPNGEENTGKLVIELPPDAAPRAAVLRFASRKSSARGFGNIDDHGQHYVFSDAGLKGIHLLPTLPPPSPAPGFRSG